MTTGVTRPLPTDDSADDLDDGRLDEELAPPSPDPMDPKSEPGDDAIDGPGAD